MDYPSFKFSNLSSDTVIQILPNKGPDWFYVKVWKLEASIANDISKGLALNEIPYQSYINRDRGVVVYHFQNEEDLLKAKFLI